jgi:disulfide bond formation protein DsbB
MKSIKNKLILNCILFFSIFALSSAYFIQYILNHQPCNLCLIERIPYFSSIILISLMFFLNRYEKAISTLLALLFLFGATVSFYHFGIEQGFFSEAFVCELGNYSSNTSADEILKELQKKTISCKDVTFKFLGLSLATFNTVISLILSVIMIKIVKNYGKN